MVNSIIIISDKSPIGSNSTAESIRIGSGLMAYGNINVQIVFRGDAVYFLNKKLDPEAVNMDPIAPALRLVELTKIDILVLEESLKRAGLNHSDLINVEKLRIINEKELANLMLNAGACIRF
jgi:sulfur relay (sulfurtransferase) DsrF/TusC family protein